MVVARYNEDVSWLADWLDVVDKITVYDKSEVPMTSPHPKVEIVPCENVGRESHTYATHFYERYDSLCDRVICTQGWYRDHVPELAFWDLVLGTEDKCPATMNGLDVSWNQTVMEHFKYTVEHNHRNAGPMLPAGMTLGDFFLAYVGTELPPKKEVGWWVGAIFRVKASQVRRHPRATYREIRDVCGASPNPEAGHMMERLWKCLFS